MHTADATQLHSWVVLMSASVVCIGLVVVFIYWKLTCRSVFCTGNWCLPWDTGGCCSFNIGFNTVFAVPVGVQVGRQHGSCFTHRLAVRKCKSGFSSTICTTHKASSLIGSVFMSLCNTCDGLQTTTFDHHCDNHMIISHRKTKLWTSCWFVPLLIGFSLQCTVTTHGSHFSKFQQHVYVTWASLCVFVWRFAFSPSCYARMSSQVDVSLCCTVCVQTSFSSFRYLFIPVCTSSSVAAADCETRVVATRGRQRVHRSHWLLIVANITKQSVAVLNSVPNAAVDRRYVNLFQ